jgi:WD40 repeat protein
MSEPERPDETAASPYAAAAPEAVPAAPAGDILPLVPVPERYYEVQGEEGRGGIGVVLRALDRRLGRVVALKQLRRAGALAEERFEREMRITARLQHAGIVPVHEAGYFESGEAFYTMRLVEGRSLRARLDACASLDERLAFLPQVLAVAETVAYAHSRRIIHRDLKPDNVVVGDYGEAVVIDWGLAKELGAAEPEAAVAPALDDTGLTIAGEVVGTPAYMPPEQARGEDVDERADVWALGGILYYLLAAGHPYDGASSAEILARVRVEPPPPLASRQEGVPPELAAIVERAMARAREARYRSASELAADLRRFLTGQLVSAHRYSTGMLLRRWARRHRAALLVTAVALTTLAVIGGYSVSKVVASGHLAERRAEQLTLAEARRSLNEDPAHALALLTTYPEGGEDWASVRAIVASAAGAGLPHDVLAVRGKAAVAFAQDGRRYALLERDRLRVLDARSGTLEQSFALDGDAPADAYPTRLEWLPDGSLVTASSGGTLHLLERGAPPLTLAPGHGPILDAGIDAKGTRLVAACEDGSVWLWDRQARAGRVLERHGGRVYAVAFAGEQVVSAGEGGKLHIFDPGTGASRVVPLTRDVLAALAISADGRRAAVGSEDGDVWIVELASGGVTALHRLAQSPVILLGFARGDAALVSLTTSGQMVMHDLASLEGTVLLTDGSWFALSQGGAWLAAGRRGGRLALTHLPSGWQRELPAHPGAIRWAAVTDSGHLATTGDDGSARLWPETLVPARIVDGASAVVSLNALPGAGVVVAHFDGTLVRLAADGSEVARAQPHRTSAATRLLGDGRRVLSVEGSTGTVVVLDERLTELRRWTLGDPLSEFRLRGARLACALASGAIAFLPIEGGEPRRVAVFAPGHAVRRLRWLDDRRLVAASANGELALVDADDGTSHALPGLPAAATQLSVLPGERLLVHSDDGVLRALALATPGQAELASCTNKHRRLAEAKDVGLVIWACARELRVVADGRLAARAPFVPEDVLTVDASAHAQRVAAGLLNGWFSLWDVAGARLASFPVALPVTDLQLVDAAAQVVALAIPGGQVLFWRVADHDLIPVDEAALRAWMLETTGHFESIPARK